MTALCHTAWHPPAWPGSTSNTCSETKGESPAQPRMCTGLAGYHCGASTLIPREMMPMGAHLLHSYLPTQAQANPLLACSSHSYRGLCFCSTISHLGVSGIKQDNLAGFSNALDSSLLRCNGPSPSITIFFPIHLRSEKAT